MSHRAEQVELAQGERICPDCKGHRKINMVWYWEDPCRTCEGAGKVSDPNGRQEADLLNSILSWRVGEGTTIAYGANNEFFNVDPGDLVHVNRKTGTIHAVRQNLIPRRCDGKIEEGRVDLLVKNIDAARHMERLEEN